MKHIAVVVDSVLKKWQFDQQTQSDSLVIKCHFCGGTVKHNFAPDTPPEKRVVGKLMYQRLSNQITHNPKCALLGALTQNRQTP